MVLGSIRDMHRALQMSGVQRTAQVSAPGLVNFITSVAYSTFLRVGDVLEAKRWIPQYI